ALQKRVGGKVELKNEVDHTLLGGVKVALEGKVYDGTLRGKLNELQRQLQQGGNAQ
ncbi:MAG: F0F1 ATP synthase subunit delta, partial [Bacilli bacterium]|nr:F0F1 ATP synthase subunit delta [Bacilli bacterium]